jgi:NAD(P) transhydrogenase
MQTRTYDVAVIGGGPGGFHAALQAASSGAKTALIDRRPHMGGVSLNAGTIPSKTLREAVMYFSGVRQRAFYGEDYRFKQDVNFNDLVQRVDSVLQKEFQVIDNQMNQLGIDVIGGQASFADPHTLTVSTLEEGPVEQIRADNIIIAVGTVPRRPDDIPFDQKVIFDSNFIFSTKNKSHELPKSLIVLGSGVIGTEYACMFATLGCEVWLVDRRKELFRFLDHDIHDQLLLAISRAGVQLVLEDDIEEISRTEDNRGRVKLSGRKQPLEADAVLFAMGRTPCSYTLELENTQVKTAKYGVIEVNENFQTGEPHIYAVGDVIGFPALASTSAEQGRMAARHSQGLDTHSQPELFPFAIYSIPEIAMIGKTEQELIAEEVPYEQGVAFYRDLTKGAIVGDLDGALKLLFHKETLQILGVHMIGDQAAELVHIGVMAMSAQATMEIFTKNVFNFPTLAEAYNVAARNGLQSLEDQTPRRETTLAAAQE